jgi:hypothetical protein
MLVISLFFLSLLSVIDVFCTFLLCDTLLSGRATIHAVRHVLGNAPMPGYFFSLSSMYICGILLLVTVGESKYCILTL